MSYILDALKKSQAEQNAGNISLNLHNRPKPRPWLKWLLAGFGVLALGNAALLAYILLPTEPRSNSPLPVNQQQPEIASREPATSAQQDIRRAVPADQPTRQQANPAATPAALAPPPTQTQATAAAPPKPLARLQLAQLAASERTLYDSFNYSTHIFTDDPSLCAVVIDGTRLMAGDAYKGLKVVEITETGVVFAETRAGVSREVEVSVLEQWDS